MSPDGAGSAPGRSEGERAAGADRPDDLDVREDAVDDARERSDTAEAPESGEAADARDAPETGPATGRDADLPTPAEIEQPSPTAADRAALDRLVEPARADRTVLPGLAAVAAGLPLTGGAGGLVAALALVALWRVAAPVYVAAASAVAYVAVARTTGGLLAPLHPFAAALAAGGVGWLVVAPVVRDRNAGALVLPGVAGAALTGGALAAGLALRGATGGAAALVAAVGLGLYGVHRYGLVRLADGDLE